jgi:hypothetical protein
MLVGLDASTSTEAESRLQDGRGQKRLNTDFSPPSSTHYQINVWPPSGLHAEPHLGKER